MAIYVVDVDLGLWYVLTAVGHSMETIIKIISAVLASKTNTGETMLKARRLSKLKKSQKTRQNIH